MLRVGVCVSGGGTNLQAIIDRVNDGTIQNASIEVVISNNKNAYALERAKQNGIRAEVLSPRNFENREAFHEAFMDLLDSCQLDLVVLAGFLVILPPQLFEKYELEIERISFDSATSVSAYAGDVKIELGEPDNMDLKIAELDAILPELEGLKGTLYLDNIQSGASSDGTYYFKQEQ